MLAADLIERLLDFAGADSGGDKPQREARRAMQEAIRLFPGLHRWTYGYTDGRVILRAPQSDGTVEYVHDDLELTLTGATWPSWAAGAFVRIGDVVSKVATRVDDDQLTLDATLNPGQDIAAGTEHVIYLDRYTLPADFLASDAAISEQWFGELEYVNAQDYMRSVRSADRSGTPTIYTFLPDVLLPGRLAIAVCPYPDADATLDFLYQRRLRPVRYDIVEDGKVTIAADGTTVTGVGTAFRSNMVGSYIRFSLTGERPTGPDGVNPTQYETKITAVANATSLTVADDAPETYTLARYVISDLLDVEEGAMATALAWQANVAMAANLQMKNLNAIEGQALSKLLLAKEHDSRSFALQAAGPRSSRRSHYFPTGPDE